MDIIGSSQVDQLSDELCLPLPMTSAHGWGCHYSTWLHTFHGSLYRLEGREANRVSRWVVEACELLGLEVERHGLCMLAMASEPSLSGVSVIPGRGQEIRLVLDRTSWILTSCACDIENWLRVCAS